MLAAVPAACADTPSPGSLYEDGPSGRYLLAGTWYGRDDPHDRGEKLGWGSRESPVGWHATTVPNAANAGDYSARSYRGGVWWYRKDFELPRSDAHATWILRFESVNYRATVWLNGHRIGSHAGGYVPFEVVARHTRPGDTNILVVRVDSRRTRRDVPSGAAPQGGRYVGGWWNYAGILREVYLRKVERLDFTTVFARPSLPCATCAATVQVNAIVANFGDRPARPIVEGRIGSQALTFTPGPIRSRGYRLFRATVRIDKPLLWSPAAPNLYEVALRVRLAGRIVQTHTLHTGIRSISMDGRGRVLLNGSPVSLRGASMYEDDSQLGAALGAPEIRANIDGLRQLGATVMRAPYPLHPLTLELADRLGILVWSEVPVYRVPRPLFESGPLRRQAKGIVRALVTRDRSHPSVLVWSLGSANTTRPGRGLRRYVASAVRLIRQLDPTRLVGLSLRTDPTARRDALYEKLDALGVDDNVSRASLGPYLDRLHSSYPRQALFVTELGAEANRDGPVGEKGTYAFQRDFLAYHLGVLATKPFINGAILSSLKDFHVAPGFDGGNPKLDPPVNHTGLVDLAGAPKPAFSAVKRLFAAGTAPR